MTIVNDTTKTLADRLRLSRLMAGYEQADIARELGVARTTVSTWERGLTEPSASNFVRWADLTGQSLEWFAECARRDSNPQPSDWESGHPTGYDPETGEPTWFEEHDTLDVELAFWAIVEPIERQRSLTSDRVSTGVDL